MQSFFPRVLPAAEEIGKVLWIHKTYLISWRYSTYKGYLIQPDISGGAGGYDEVEA
jgi:hypothetical protein